LSNNNSEALLLLELIVFQGTFSQNFFQSS
jgi:hypothetical protein